MLVAALVLAALAAVLHGYIFVLESVRFDEPATWRIFGVRGEADARVLRPLFYNQGWYNLFLGVGCATGVGLTAGGSRTVGLTLVVFCCASMLGAALVLVGSDRTKARAALVQGTAPALALLDLGVWALVGG